MPGAVIRTDFLRKIMEDIGYKSSWDLDLMYMSTMISLGFWKKNWMVYIAPNSSYCTTEEYVNDIGHFDLELGDLKDKFNRESI